MECGTESLLHVSSDNFILLVLTAKSKDRFHELTTQNPNASAGVNNG